MINAQFTTQENVQEPAQPAVQSRHTHIASAKKLNRVDNSILRKEARTLHKVHKYHLKINAKLDKTIAVINKARNVMRTKGEGLANRLAKYGTRKLGHLMEYYNMADDDLKQQIKPIVDGMVSAIRQKEQTVRAGIQKLVTTFYAVLDRTLKQLAYAKQVGDANNNAAKTGIHAIGDNISKGLKTKQSSFEINTHNLRKVKRISKGAEKQIAHEYHKAEKKEIAILKTARALLKQMRRKGKHVFSKLRHQAKAEYRALYRKCTKKIIKILLNQNGGVEDYEY
ncbi:hypothetical protein EDI_317210 [Entamoeba dispar SAW760]|uniref:Uncharacterized protein n=1 Tax=Entamoeba dispar (strain ATCC PRA-260 / SAW760) TaxID=370354 RepID=B0EB47_ENTDS|nr:uncharacterized protein EDI_317210 [Entamoeba dispar SAW760]EDR28264.1 hypothetical protein EDI_317210 [Entamoeba dispar SAW760]|eukprot:EDR28264.1 hypothetical protein EDI_317210 [Entamoeba dispar SAW760]